MRKVILLVLVAKAFMFCTFAHADYYYNPLTISSEYKQHKYLPYDTFSMIGNSDESLLPPKTLFCQALGDEDGFWKDENKKTKRTFKGINPYIAVTGAAVLPVIGHAYIGGDNVNKGLLYTLTDATCYLGITAYDDEFASKLRPSFQALLIFNHAINIIDAYKSVKRMNTNSFGKIRKRNSLIAVSGSTLLPVIGHTYIGGDNIGRGILYTTAELLLFDIGMQIAIDLSPMIVVISVVFVATHVISIIDAYKSAKRINTRAIEQDNNKNYMIIPDFKSRRIRLAWSF